MTLAVDEVAAQPPEAATVLVTVYVPGVEAEAVIAPVEAFSIRPVVEVNVPAVAPAANAAVWLPVALVQ